MASSATDRAATFPIASGSAHRERTGGRRPLRIGIDISRTIGQRTGVGSYASRLVEGLAAVDRENEYLLYPYFWECFHPEWRTARIPESPQFRLWCEDRTLEEINQRWTTAPADEVVGGVDVLHSTAFTVPPPLSEAKLVVTVPDLTFLTHPELHTEANRSFCLRQADLWSKRAAYLITLSESARSDILRYLSFPEERVVAIPLAAAPEFVPSTDLGAVRRVLASHDIRDNYVLFVGTLEPRKNAITLLRACADVLRVADPPHLLVLAGASGWMNSEVFAEVRALQLEERVRFLGYVPDADLQALYTAARVFVYPSLYEGFGLPVIEAMACGAPVITSTTSSLPEVAGDAALLVPPTDVIALRGALEEVLNSHAKRLQMRAASRRQAERFSWQETARKTLAVYRKAVDEA